MTWYSTRMYTCSPCSHRINIEMYLCDIPSLCIQVNRSIWTESELWDQKVTSVVQIIFLFFFSIEIFSEMEKKLVLVSLCCLLLLVGGANAQIIYDTDPDNNTFDIDVQLPCPEDQWWTSSGECIDEETVLIFDKKNK